MHVLLVISLQLLELSIYIPPLKRPTLFDILFVLCRKTLDLISWYVHNPDLLKKNVSRQVQDKCMVVVEVVATSERG